jgi:iron complex outermembrane recepter protein
MTTATQAATGRLPRLSVPPRLRDSLATCAMLAACTSIHAQGTQGVIEELIVTAQKREQSLQDVGIAITALSGDDIKELGLRDADDIATFTPNLTAVNSYGNNMPNFSIRGVGLNDIAPTNSSPTAVHVDEVYYAYSAMLNFGLFDIERVEVLKGPQGTLYGRNTTAGAISYFTRRPTEHFESAIKVGYGNYQAAESEGYVSGPLSQTTSGRLSGFYRRQSDGPYYNRHLDTKHGEVDVYGWRAQLATRLGDDVTINLNVHGGEDNSDVSQYNVLPSGNAALNGHCAAFLNATLRGGEPDCFGRPMREQEPDTDPFVASPGFRPSLYLKSLGGTLTATWSMPSATLTSVSGYEELDRFLVEDADGFATVNVDSYHENHIAQLSQELRLTSDGGGAWNWIVGAYGLSDRIDTPRYETKAYARGVGIGLRSHQETKTAAGFGQAEWQFATHWRAIGGLRYTWEQRSFDATSTMHFNSDPFAVGAPAQAPFVQLAANDDRNSFSDLSGKVAVELAPGDDQLYYASVSKGFKSGGFNGNFAFSDAEFNAYDEEELFAYEVGSKIGFDDRRLFWNTALFYYDYQNIQAVGQFETSVGGLPVNLLVLTNLADARTLGAETDLWWRPGDRWDLKLGAGYLDAQFVDAQPGNESLNGNRLTYAPQLTVNGAARYSMPVPGDLTLRTQLDFSYRDSYYTGISNIAITETQAYTLVNGRIALMAGDERWEVALWARNLLDEEYTPYINNLPSTFRVLTVAGYPRTYGLQFEYRVR